VGASLNGDNDVEACSWSEATGMVGLGDIPGGTGQSIARAVSSDGTVVADEAYIPGGTTVAFSWAKTTGMVRLPDFQGGNWPAR